MHVRPGYREKSADLQGTFKLHDFINKFGGCRHPAIKIAMENIPCVLAAWLQMHPCLKGNLRETWARVFSLLVL